MLYHIDPLLLQKYPGYVRGLVIVRRAINIAGPIDEVQRLLLGAQKAIRQRADLEPPAAHPHIAAWREAYRAFGAKPSEYPSSIEALVKRVRRGDEACPTSIRWPPFATAPRSSTWYPSAAMRSM